MCSPQAVLTTTNVLLQAANTVKTVASVSAENKNYEYQQQIALTKARDYKDKALEEQQTGIQKSREEKIKGLAQIGQKQAQNAASGFDMFSTTNMYQYSDIEALSEMNANSVENEYYQKSKDYLERSREYLKNASYNVQKQNNYLFNTALGVGEKAASKWYDFVNENIKKEETLIGYIKSSDL